MQRRGIDVAGHVLRWDLVLNPRHADRRMHAQQPQIGLTCAHPRPGQRPDGPSLFHHAGDDTGASLRLLLIRRPPPVLIQQPRRFGAVGDGDALTDGCGPRHSHHNQDLADVLGKALPL